MAPIKHNLVALGSAAVLAVYAAGFARTRAAAARFADESAERRPAPPAEREARAVPSAAPTSESPHAQLPAPASTIAAGAAPKKSVAPSPPAAKQRHAGDGAASRTDSTPATKTAATPAATAAAPVTTTPATTTQATQSTAGVSPPAPVKDTAGAAANAAPPADTARAATAAAYKDGTYTGWGTSRHGDIQATVMIKGGRIVGAVISECLTRYSCSWIAALPNQVIERQSAEVDYVSGATQSANAFYYAVVEALKKAK